MRSTVLAVPVLAVVMQASGCADPPPAGAQLTLVSHPHALDRYARLSIQELTDADPEPTHRLMECETSRLHHALGSREATLRIAASDDSIRARPAAREALARIDERLHGKVFEVGGAYCDSINVTADREDPIAAADSAIRNRP